MPAHAPLSAWLLCLTILSILSGCVSNAHRTRPAASGIDASVVIDTRTLLDLPRLVERIADRRVIYVGETHDRYEHHRVQLEIIRQLHTRGLPLTIALEFFQQPYQPWLDRWVAGEIDEAEMLRRTEYFQRWRFDYRLYRPILRFAREQRIPLVALNVPREVTEAVSRKGFEGLDASQRRWVPNSVDTSDMDYRQRLEEVFSQHPARARKKAFQHFYEAQLLWDEGMAARLADYLRKHPKRTVVVLAGSGHVAFRRGIPDRLKRRLAVDDAVIVLGAESLTAPEVADYVVAPVPQALPPRGLLGIFMEDTARGVLVAGFSRESAARRAGLRKGDRLLAIDGHSVERTVDVRLALLDARPGQRVVVEIERGQGRAATRRRYTVELGAPPAPAHP